MGGVQGSGRGQARWGFVAGGAVLLPLAAAFGYTGAIRYETDCRGILHDPVTGDPCAGAHTPQIAAVAALGLLGLGLILFGLAPRLHGGRLLLAGVLVVGIWGTAVAGTSWLVHLDACGSVTLPSGWTGYPVPPANGAFPADCPGRLGTRRFQAGGLFAASALLLGALVVLVVRTSEEEGDDQSSRRMSSMPSIGSG